MKNKFSKGIGYLVTSIFVFVISLEEMTMTDKTALIALSTILLIAYLLNIFTNLEHIVYIGILSVIVAMAIEFPMGVEKILFILISIILIGIFILKNIKDRKTP